MVHISQMQKARWSVNMENPRFLRATRLPVDSQNSSSSGSQWSIQ